MSSYLYWTPLLLRGAIILRQDEWVYWFHSDLEEIAVLRGEEGIIGFANIMPMYDNGEGISVDLMRFKPEAPSGTMDFIFLSLLEWAKEEGYRRFNMGMSPLSNVGQSNYSFVSEKVAAQIFLHGQYF